MKSIVLSTCALAVVVGVVAMAQQNPMTPGRWQLTMQMQMPGVPVQMPATSTTSCVTAEQLAKDPAAGLPTAPGAGRGRGNNDSCKSSDYKVVGNTATWKVVCTGQQAMTGDGQMTFVGETYTGAIKMVMPQGEMTMKLDGKRLGDCTN